ncbi:MAG: TIR domain-containing protein [Pseudomonadota bacterium]
MGWKIFINYRRDDSAPYAMIIAQYLERRFGSRNVFIDIDRIRAGQEFPKILEGFLAQTNVMLVVIGPDWLTVKDDNGRPRLESSNDWVRLEIEQALARNIPIIPVTVAGATLPGSASLLPSLSRLADFQAISVSTDSFRHDMAGLVRDITSSGHGRTWMATAAVAMVFVLALAGGLGWWFRNDLLAMRPLGDANPVTVRQKIAAAKRPEPAIPTTPAASEAPKPAVAKDSVSGLSAPAYKPKSEPKPTLQPRVLVKTSRTISAIAPAPSSSKVAISGEISPGQPSLSVWDYATGEKIIELAADNRRFERLYWSTREDLIYAVPPYQGGTHQVFEFHVRSGTERVAFETSQSIGSLIIDDKGLQAVILKDDSLLFFLDEKTRDQAWRRDRETWGKLCMGPQDFFTTACDGDRPEADQTLRNMRCYPGHPAVHVKSMNQLIMMGSRSCFLIWDLKTRTPLRLIKMPDRGIITDAVVSPDEKIFAFGSYKGNVHIWDMTNWKEIRTIRAHSDSIDSIIFSNDSKSIVTDSGKCRDKIKAWDLLTGAKMKDIYDKAGLCFFDIKLGMKNNRLLASGYDVTVLSFP